MIINKVLRWYKLDTKAEMKYYLGLVDEYEVPEGYDCYVWAGEFCVNGIEWCRRNGKKFEVLKDEEITRDDVQIIYNYLEKVKNKTIDYLKRLLNEYHQTDYSEFKWKVLLNFWLAYFLPSIYDKYLMLKRIKDESRLFHAHLYKSDCTGVALDQLDFGEMLQDDFGFHKYEYSLLMKNISDINNIIVDESSAYERMPLCVNYTDLPEHVASFANEYREYKEMTNIPDEIVIQSPYIKFTLYKELMERKYGKISGYFLDYLNKVRKGMVSNRTLDIEWRTRRRHIEKDETDKFVCLVYKIIGNFIPIAYLEEFDNLKTIAMNNYKWGLKPRILLYDCEGVAINEMFKIYMMNIDLEHVLKVDLMHGIPTGAGGFSWYELTELQMCDDYLISCEVPNNTLANRFIRMPYINFFRCPEWEKGTGNTIIYTNYSYPQHRGRLSLNEWNWKKYMNGELEFFRMLDRSVISELKFRLHPYHKSQWRNKENIKKIVPDLIFDDEPSFFDSIYHAKLVISEIMGSAAMEAMGVGKPTIILYNPINLFVELNDNYKDIEDMIRVGIIAETPEKLAALVNTIHNDVEGWWNEPERQKVVNKICNKYAYFPKNAKEIWIKKIMAYLEEG